MNQPIEVHLSEIEDCLAKMDDFLENKRTMPFSSNVSVDKNALFDIIDEIRNVMHNVREDLPEEITRAKAFISNNDKLTTDARNKAQAVIKSAEAEAEQMTAEHEITKAAQEQAAELLDKARQDARDLRLNAREYADELLEKTDKYVREAREEYERAWQNVDTALRETLETVYENRQQLRES